MFDDEATVKNDKNHQSRCIVFAQAKSIVELKSLKTFFGSIKNILNDLGIKSGKITQQQQYVDKNGVEKVVLRFTISGKVNLEIFLRTIGFTNKNKFLRLEKCIQDFKDLHSSKRSILEILSKSDTPLSTLEITNRLNINNKLADYHLRELYASRKVEKRIENRCNLWKLK